MTSLIGKVLDRAPRPSTVPRAITLPFATRNDAETQMKAYGSVSTLFAIVGRITDAVSQVEWRMYRDQVDGRRVTAVGSEEEARTEVIRHAALQLLNFPNPFMTRQDLFETVEQHTNLTGEGCIIVVRSELADLPLELWPVRPDRIIPVPHPENFLAGYVYLGPDGEKVPLRLDEVIHIKLPNPLDPYRGLGPVQATLVDLDSARYSAEWNRNFFLNGAEPGGHLETELNLGDDDYNDLVTRWREQHQGVWNAHRVAVLEGGVKWKDRQFTMKDMQFAELRGVSREIIREAFGIHAHMLGLSEDVNKANAQEGERSFARWIVTPRARRWKLALNRKLLPMFGVTGQGVFFDHDRIVPEDREADDRERLSKANSAAALVKVGYDPDDVAAAFGLPQMGFTQRDPVAVTDSDRGGNGETDS